MCKKILVFDGDGIDPRLEPVFQNRLDDPDIRMTGVESLEDFEKKILEKKWSHILINFHTPLFWDLPLSAISQLILTIKKSQKGKLNLTCLAVVPEMIAALKKSSVVKIQSKRIDLIDLRQSLSVTKEYKIGGTAVTIRNIANLVSKATNISTDKFGEKTRKREIVEARHLAMFLAKRYVPETLRNIGEYFGGRDHTTVIHALVATRDHMDTDEDFKRKVLLLQEKIEEMFNCVPIPEGAIYRCKKNQLRKSKAA